MRVFYTKFVVAVCKSRMRYSVTSRSKIFCWLEFSTGYYLQAKRSEVIRDNLKRSEKGQFGLLQPSCIPMYSRTKSAIAIGQFFLSPLHHKATIRNQSHHKMTEIIICNARANPCAPYSIPLKLLWIFRWVTPRHQ